LALRPAAVVAETEQAEERVGGLACRRLPGLLADDVREDIGAVVQPRPGAHLEAFAGDGVDGTAGQYVAGRPRSGWWQGVPPPGTVGCVLLAQQVTQQDGEVRRGRLRVRESGFEAAAGSAFAERL